MTTSGSTVGHESLSRKQNLARSPDWREASEKKAKESRRKNVRRKLNFRAIPQKIVEIIKKLNTNSKLKAEWITDLLKFDLSDLVHLSVDAKIISHNLVKILAQATKIEELELTDKFQVTPEVVRNVLKLQELKKLNISYASINDPKEFVRLLKSLGGNSKIQSIKAKGCIGLKDSAIKALSKINDLSRLDIRQCKDISDTGLKHLAGIKKLDHITFGGGQETLEGSLDVCEQKHYHYYRYTEYSDSENESDEL